MTESRIVPTFAFRVASRAFSSGTAFLAAVAIFLPTVQAPAQQTQSPPSGRVIVIGEGSVSVIPDYAQIGSGVTTKAKTVKEATDANSRSMATVMKALLDFGVAQSDIQTSQFSLQPVYEPQGRAESKFVGYSVSNRVRVKIRQIGQVGEVLDRLVSAGATDIGNVEFLVSEGSTALDRAREAAIADARRRADVYAQSAGIRLGGVEWVSEVSGFGPPAPMLSPEASAATAASVPITGGEDTLRVRITVGFEIVR